MLNNRPYATLDEFSRFIKQLGRLYLDGTNWFFAVSSGWDEAIFDQLYKEYVESTQKKIGPKDDALTLKAKPLEAVSRYLLEKGGLARRMTEILQPGKWQVDGHGPVNKDAVLTCWGETICNAVGPQVYMEAKNHTEPVEKEEFSDHYRAWRSTTVI
jgi:hypothetical protein